MQGTTTTNLGAGKQSPATVSWRLAAAALVALALVIGGVVAFVRSDGLNSIDAAQTRATAWFTHQGSGRVVLVDGFGGQAIARIEAAVPGESIEARSSSTAAFFVNRSTAQTRVIDQAALRLGPGLAVASLTASVPTTAAGTAGLTVVDPQSGESTLVSPDGQVAPFVSVRGEAVVAPNGSVWSVDTRQLHRARPNESSASYDAPGADAITLNGNLGVVLDRADGRLLTAGAGWVELTGDPNRSDLVVQAPGPADDCTWVGAGDHLWCVAAKSVVHDIEIAGLNITASDLLAVSGDVAVVVHRATPGIVRFDWRTASIVDTATASVPSDASLAVTVTDDLIWVDDVAGDFVWAIHEWGLNAIEKNDDSVPLLGESGEVVSGGDAPRPGFGAGAAGASPDEGWREPDDNGVDDPPVAVDDQVSARGGAPIPIAVTANDYDPDGEAIVVVGASAPSSGAVEVASATTIVYTPVAGFIGIDQFTYRIADGNGTEAMATVTVEVLDTNAPNQAPTGQADFTETGVGTAVVVDVLLNDTDPERDALRIGSFTTPTSGGAVSEAIGRSGLPALRYEPPVGVSGKVTFLYRPEDSRGAVGETVEVTVLVATGSEGNRPPQLRPDAVRVRIATPTLVAVLANDLDPDGDPLSVTLIEPFPPGVTARVVGDQVEVTAGAGAIPTSIVTYEVDDGHDHQVRSSVLVYAVGAEEPNRPPLVYADTATMIVGEAHKIDVLLNDSDPDGDPLSVIAVTQPAAGGTVVNERRGVRFSASPLNAGVDERTVRFTYTVTDGQGHDVAGEVSVRVLALALPTPPWAQDDVATTEVDTPVVIDVLRNDGDPSGERPTLVGAPSCPSGGSARIRSDQGVTFSPPAGKVGAFRCMYEVTNSRDLRASASIIITVVEPPNRNQPPVAQDDERTIKTNEVIEINVLANDEDPDGEAGDLKLVSVSTPRLGTVRIASDQVRYSASATPGVVTMRYEVTDGDGGTVTGRIIVTVVEPDPVAPVANDDLRSPTAPVESVVIDMLANDHDPDGNVSDLVVTGVQLTAGAAQISHVKGTLTVVPSSTFVGKITVAYTIVDLDGLSDQGLVVVTVTAPRNRPPEARNVSATVESGGLVRVALDFFDLDGGDLIVELLSKRSDIGDLTRDGGAVVFQSKPGAEGFASFVYRVSDGELMAEASISITVQACGVSSPIIVNPNAVFTTGYQQPFTVPISGLFSGGELIEVAPALSGLTYTPPAGENGVVSFTYRVRNACRQTTSGAFSIDVNRSPEGHPQSINLPIGGTSRLSAGTLATDPDGQTLVLSLPTKVPSWVAIDNGELFIAAPSDVAVNGLEVLARITDPGGLFVDVPVTVTVANQPPIASDVTITVIRFDEHEFLLPCSDPDQQQLSMSEVPKKILGVKLEVDGASNDRVRFDPAEVEGVASFPYVCTDPLGASDSATVTIDFGSRPVALQVGTLNMVPNQSRQVTVVDGGFVVAVRNPPENPLFVSLTGTPQVIDISAPPGTPSGTYEVRYTIANGRFFENTQLMVTVAGNGGGSTTTTTTPTTTTTTTVPGSPVTTTTVPTTTTTTTVPTTTTTVPTTPTVPPGP